MYRNLYFQLIFENIYRILLLLMMINYCFPKILFCSYKSDFLKFNDIIIRETVSSENIKSYFAVNIKKTNFDIKTDYTSNCFFLDQYPLTNYQFKDTVINNNTITILNNNYTTHTDHMFNIIGIFKSSPLNKKSKPLLINFIYDNNIILSQELTVNMNTISFYEEFLSEPGYHSFKIQVESEGIWCLCPSTGDGYQNNKYVFAWIDSNPLLQYNQEYTYLTKIQDNEYSIIV